MTSAQKIQIGLWGYGRHSKKNIIPALLESNVCHLAGVCTTSDDKECEIKEKYNVVVWRNPEAMLGDPNIHAVYLATPIGLHHVQGKQVLAANRHLLCEKSLTNDRSKSLELIDLAEKMGVVILETFMYLHHPQFQIVQEVVRGSDFGAITSIVSNFCIPSLDTPGFRNSKALGGSAFWDVGCYPVSLALSLVKESPKIEFCEINVRAGEDVDVAGKALIGYPSKAAAYLNWGYNHSYKNDLTILGEQKSVYVDRVFSKSRDMPTTVQVMDMSGAKIDITIPAADSFVRMFEVFAQAIDEVDLKLQLRDQANKQSELMSHLFNYSLPTD